MGKARNFVFSAFPFLLFSIESQCIMQNKILTTWFSVGFATFLTLVKFFFWYLSGSVAVLSESFHSLSDIATSLVILISLYRNRLPLIIEEGIPDSLSDLSVEKNDNGSSMWRNIRAIHHELKISLVIGFGLLIVSGSILWKVFSPPPDIIERPLLTGSFFILFSMGSYLLYRVQTGVASLEHSAALHADGTHSRADALISFLTGATLLVFYFFNVNLDRYMGGIIAFIIFVFSLEILTNSIFCMTSRNTAYVQRYTASHITAMFFNYNTYKNAITRCLQRIPSMDPEGSQYKIAVGIRKLKKVALFFLISGMGLGYISTCFYQIDIGHRGLKLRFGRIVNANTIETPGLHVKLPWPLETIVKINTEKISTIAVGNLNMKGRLPIWALEHGNNISFISGDNTLFLPYTSIHYKISNPLFYYLYPKDSEKLIKSIGLSLLTREFLNWEFYDLALSERKIWMDNIFSNLQRILDEMRCGVEIVGFHVQDLHPPATVAPSFEKVVASLQQKEQLLNQAIAFKNEYIPRVRGEAYKNRKKAQIYVREITKKAEGETRNYVLRHQGYRTGSRIIEKLLYHQTVREALKASGKRIIVDPETGINSKRIYNEEFLFRLDR